MRASAFPSVVAKASLNAPSGRIEPVIASRSENSTPEAPFEAGSKLIVSAKRSSE